MKTLPHPTFLRPTTLHDAAIALTRPGARLSAGGTAIETERAAGAPRLDLLIDLSLIEDQDFRTCTPDRIGAGVSLATIEHASHLPALLRQAATSVAAPSIRRLATLGGQIGGKTGCTLPALLVLDASVIFRDQNTEHTLTLARWLAAPRGLITGISLPPLAPAALTGFRKTGFRQSFSPSAITIASRVEHTPRNRFRTVRLAAGGGPTPPARLPDTEAWLARQPPDAVDWRQFRQRVFHEIRTTGDLKRSAAWRACVAANTLALTLGGPAALPAPPEHTRHTPKPLLPLPPETELTRPTSPHQRPDMAAKIHGEPHFHTDRRHTPDGTPLLTARILRSPVPHALITEPDVSEANSMPGIRAIITARDIPGDNAYGIVRQDQPVFARDRVRYTGEAIAAIAADTPAQADAALAKIRVRYEDLPIVSDPVQALAPDAPLLHPDHPDGNLCARATITHGDPGPVWERCAVIVEATYITPRQMHAYMETEGGWARQRKDGILEIYAGSQYGLRDRHQLARILARDPESIRVVSGPTGGSFGGKDDLTVQPALCLLALKSGQPVSLRLERRESVIAGQKSAPFRIHMRTGCDAEGHILAHQADLIADSGAYASLSPAVLDTAVEHACGPYHIPNHHIEGRLAYTSNGVTGAFRGFGANQVNFALESQIDRLAAKLSLDPVTIRARNLRRPGDPGAFGHQVASSENVAEMLRAASASPLWTTPRGHLSGSHLPDRAVTAGVGMALIYQGNGLGSQLPDPAAARLRLRPDGKIEAAADLVEMGQGVVAVLQTVTARALGCTPEDVAPLAGDTDIGLDSGSTSASRGSISAFLGLEGAAIPFREQLLTAASAALGLPASELRPGPGGIHSATGNNAPLMSYAELAATCPDALPEASFHSAIPAARWTRDNARFLFCGGAVIARIELSLADGQIRVTDTELHSAAGPVLSHAGYMGQMEGALLQATGFSLMENIPFVSGHSQTQNFDSYMLPTIADTPETVRIFAYEELDPSDPARSRGIGEVGMSSLAPALANAVADACGTWPEHAPFRPETLLNACGTGPHALQEPS
ncbi:molybdopterin-dependent oxidoreductase [Acetobacter musti]|uniref:Molybdopterin-dependent oxidoreductase n=1 Tax=Acetobacter musti TaxID=864732 RepID=A0ABX0JKM9_9PROT|nr:molybdopterin cofactor-binding domain-containing protein [Acetobacter musti]NHN83260.1 molybdopterin-dependent oxidoreductase [Acetobacter musti]